MVKKGDTLIEVTLAIGIFSMIAISVASVMSGGTAGAQLSLETTLAREEIDTQAEALRFIHASYTANKDNKDHPYTALWRKITARAINIEDYNKERLEQILQYAPTSCSDLYQTDAPGLSSAFVINPRELSTVNDKVGDTAGSGNLAYINYSDGTNNQKFAPASTYPHLIYGNATSNEDGEALAKNSFQTNLYRAEGIYVIPIKDPASTGLVDVLNDNYSKTSAYYDFYIRTCWYGSNTEEPSTISTVIRLHDPESIFAGGFFDAKFSGFPATTQNAVIKDKNNVRKLKLLRPERYAYTFKHWHDTNNNINYAAGSELYNTTNSHLVYNLEAIWEHTKYNINFDLDGGSANNIRNLTCYQDGANGSCAIPNETPTRSGSNFKGWCSGNIVNEVCAGQVFRPGYTFTNANLPNLFPANRNLKLKAIWSDWNETYRIALTWGETPRDLDSHVKGQKSDGTYFHAYYGSKIGSNINGLTIASLDKDVTSGYGTETFTLNTLGGKNYYYYVYCYSSCTKISGATVTLDVKNDETGDFVRVGTYKSDDATGTGRYWNVFAYKNGRIVVRQAHSSTEETDY